MLTDGIKLTEGSDIVNAVVASGTSFPALPNVGELFYRSDEPAMHVYDGTTWVQIGLTSSQLNGQPGSYYLDNANATGIMAIVNGGTGASSAAAARGTLGLVIGTNVQAFDADLSSIAALAGTTGFLKKTAADTWALDTTSYLSTAGGSIVGNIAMTGNIIPTATNTYSLGSAAFTWKDIYVGPGSLYVNGKEVISDQSNTMVFSTDLDQNLRIQTSGTGNLELQPASTGAVLMKGTLTMTSGKRITDSAGVKVEFGSSVELNGNKITGVGAPTNAGDVATKSYTDSVATTATNASTLTSGTIADARIAASSVTQHQAALTILETQITDGALLARNAGNETITGTWSFNNPVTVGTPSANSHAATKLYVDSIASGVNPQLAVRAATTGNITLGGTQTIDGVPLVAGNRILVKDQAASVLNGVYVVAAGSWTRAADFDGAPTTEVATGDLVFVAEGTTNANASYVLITPGPIVVDTTALTFSVFSRAGDLVAGTGLTRTGQSIDVIGTAGRIVANADSIDLATAGTAGTYTSITTDAYGRVTAGSTPATVLSGDITGTGTSAIATTLASVGTAGTYKSITTDAKGRVIAGTNPTTLVGFGITDAQPLNADLTAIAAISTTGIQVRSGSGTHTTRSIAVSGIGLSITSADGVGGNPTITISSATANSVSTLVARDATGSFSAGNITASLFGNATSATSATSATYIVSADTRSTATGPSTGLAQFRTDFKANSTDGLSDGGTYHGVVTFQQYSDATGGGTRQLGFTDNDNLWLRGSGTALTSYGAWKLILNSTNFSAYAPTLTGTGASGTWAISVTGNAGTVGGLATSTSAVASTVVARDSSNYVYFNYINSNTANAENATASQVITTNGTDNFYRKNSLANFGSQVGPSITALGNIVTINGISPTNGAIRLTPNLHLNAGSANAVILNWDNGGSGSNQQVRIGNGAGVDAWSITAFGNSIQTGSVTATAFTASSGTITTRSPVNYTAITSVTYNTAPIEIPSLAVPTTGTNFAPFIHGSTSLTGQGYIGHVAFGALRNGSSSWAGGAFIGLGGADANCTEYFTLGFGGAISHSSGTVTINGNVTGSAGSAAAVNMSAGRTDSTAYPVVWGTTGSASQLYSASAVTIQSSTGLLTASKFAASGNGNTVYGPNTTWGAYLYVGGNGTTLNSGANIAQIAASDGNLHMDAGTGKAMYLNYNGGSAGINFCNGAQGIAASVSAAGVFTGNGSGLSNVNASTLGGLAVNPALNTQVNQIVRTDVNGYIQAGWINTVSGDMGTAAPDRIFCSNDQYLRYKTPTQFIAGLGLVTTAASNTWTGTNYFQSNKGAASYVGANATYNLEAYSSDAGAAAMSFHRAGNYAINMGLDPDNVFRIGGWSASANRLQMDMSGNLTMAGDITAFSDARLKKDVETIDNALEKVESMRGVMFTRIEDEVRGTGVIAQEVQEILPEVVRENGDGTLSVAYGNMMGLMIEAMKELSEKVKVLEAKLAKYEGQ